MPSDKNVNEGFEHCLKFFERNYPKASLEQKNWFLSGVLTLKDYLEQK